ncbi:MAG: diaminopimelate decarboxylase, partial [Pseudomonadota bacterium]
MDFFAYHDGVLHAEGVPLPALAGQFGTPAYVYSRATLERQWRAFDQAFGSRPHLVCYAVKANSSLAILNLLARLGSGFDIVSVGELERVLAAGGDPSRVVFSGVGKRIDELRRALQAGIRCFNVEVSDELDRLSRIAVEQGVTAPVSLRVNPDVDANTHPYISTGLRENKFG